MESSDKLKLTAEPQPVLHQSDPPKTIWEAVLSFWPKTRFMQGLFVLVLSSISALFILSPTDRENIRARLSAIGRPSTPPSFLAGDFVIDLKNPYQRGTFTRVNVTVHVGDESVEPTRRAELIALDYELS